MADRADGPGLLPGVPVRVLLISDVATLVEHEAVLAELGGSELVQGLVCVAVGWPVGRDGATVLRSGSVLDRDGVATLWVGDPEGVGWELGRTAVLPPQAVPAPDAPALRTLLDVLRVPEVFDRVVHLAAKLPGHTASPGLLLVAAGGVGRRELAAAQVAAADRVVGHGRVVEDGCVVGDAVDSDLAGDLAGDLAAELLEGLEGWVPDATVRRIDAVYQATALACEQAAEDVRRLAGPIGPPITARPDAWTRAAAAGRAVGQLRSVAADLVHLAGGDAGPDLVQHEPQTDRGVLTARLRDAVEDALGRGRPLDELAATLRDAAARLAPAGSAAQLSRLAEHCPEPVVAGLVKPAPFPFRVLRPWVLVAVAVCCALAGLASWLAGALLAIVWVLAAGLAVARCPTGPGGHRPTPADTVGLRIHAAAAAIGAIAGAVGAVGGSLPGSLAGSLAGTAVGTARLRPLLPALAVPAARGALVALAVAGLWFVLRGWWYRALRSWLSGLNIYRARAATELVHRQLRDIAGIGRPAADTRRFAADAATAMADAVGAAAKTIANHAIQPGEVGLLPDGEPVPPPPDGTPVPSANGKPVSPPLDHALVPLPDAEPALPSDDEPPLGGKPALLADLIGRDLLDAVGAALRPCWQRLLDGPVDRPVDATVADGVPTRLADLLGEYQRHLELHGPSQRPAFANGPRDRTALIGPLARDSASIARLLRRSHADGLMVQLCSAADLTLLDLATGTRTIRFAPRNMRAGTGVPVDPAADPAADGAGPAVEPAEPVSDGADGAGHGARELSEEDDVVWTSPGRLAGVLRLVPLRTGAISPAAGPAVPIGEGGRR